MCVNDRKHETQKCRRFVGIYNKFEYTRSCANVSIINCATKMESMLQYSRKRKSFTRTVQSHITQRTLPHKSACNNDKSETYTKAHCCACKTNTKWSWEASHRCTGSIQGRSVVRVQKVQDEIGTHENSIPFVLIPRSATLPFRRSRESGDITSVGNDDLVLQLHIH